MLELEQHRTFDSHRRAEYRLNCINEREVLENSKKSITAQIVALEIALQEAEIASNPEPEQDKGKKKVKAK